MASADIHRGNLYGGFSNWPRRAESFGACGRSTRAAPKLFVPVAIEQFAVRPGNASATAGRAALVDDRNTARSSNRSIFRQGRSSCAFAPPKGGSCPFELAPIGQPTQSPTDRRERGSRCAGDGGCTWEETRKSRSLLRAVGDNRGGNCPPQPPRTENLVFSFLSDHPEATGSIAFSGRIGGAQPGDGTDPSGTVRIRVIRSEFQCIRKFVWACSVGIPRRIV